jgi:negative elongation factor E
MVYIHFPANFTEEELMLQAKYQKLKKKKKSSASFKGPKTRTRKANNPQTAGRGSRCERSCEETHKIWCDSGHF